jgi:prepilin peptidase CpaA
VIGSVACATRKYRFKPLKLIDIFVVSITSLSAFFDLKVRRIPNWLVLVGATSGIALNGYQGLNPFIQSIVGLVAGIAVLLVPFALGWIGAGDVKFFGVVGALLGASWLPRVFFYSALSAGLIAAAYLLFGSVQSVRFTNLWTDLKVAVFSLGRVIPDPVRIRSEGRGGSVPWGVAFAIGTIIAYYFDHTGRWAGF